MQHAPNDPAPHWRLWLLRGGVTSRLLRDDRTEIDEWMRLLFSRPEDRVEGSERVDRIDAHLSIKRSLLTRKTGRVARFARDGILVTQQNRISAIRLANTF